MAKSASSLHMEHLSKGHRQLNMSLRDLQSKFLDSIATRHLNLS